jgi:cytochrome bd-type quinol oxidase subunit 2
MLRPTFDSPWETQSSCGIANLGALALVGTLFLTGCALIALAWRAGKTRSSLRPAQALATVVAITVVVAIGVLTWRTETWPTSEPNGRRGWLSIRNATAVVALGLIMVASAASTFTAWARRHLEDD